MFKTVTEYFVPLDENLLTFSFLFITKVKMILGMSVPIACFQVVGKT